MCKYLYIAETSNKQTLKFGSVPFKFSQFWRNAMQTLYFGGSQTSRLFDSCPTSAKSEPTSKLPVPIPCKGLYPQHEHYFLKELVASWLGISWYIHKYGLIILSKPSSAGLLFESCYSEPVCCCVRSFMDCDHQYIWMWIKQCSTTHDWEW